MLPVAVTGGIACGKSTVVAAFAEMGFTTASADIVAKEIFGQSETARLLATALGLDEVPERAQLSRLISRDRSARKAVDAVMHPLIMEKIVQSQADVVEVPLLFEACIQRFFCCSLVVVCDASTQVERLLARGIEPGSASDLIGSQLGCLARTSLSDFVVRTDRPLGTVLEGVRHFGQELDILRSRDVLYSPVEPGVDSEQA